MLSFHLQAIRTARGNLDSNNYVQNLQTVQHTYTENARITPSLNTLDQEKKSPAVHTNAHTK